MAESSLVRSVATWAQARDIAWGMAGPDAREFAGVITGAHGAFEVRPLVYCEVHRVTPAELLVRQQTSARRRALDLLESADERRDFAASLKPERRGPYLASASFRLREAMVVAGCAFGVVVDRGRARIAFGLLASFKQRAA